MVRLSIALAAVACTVHAQERTDHALGSFEHLATESRVVIAAPHGTFDWNTPPIAIGAAKQLGVGHVVALRFVVDRVRINVNRPTEGAHLGCAQEGRSERANEVYAAYRKVVSAAAKKPLRLYVEIHGNTRAESQGQIELATRGVSADEARRIKTVYAASLAKLRAETPDYPELALLVEPLDRIYFTTTCAKRFGMLNAEVAPRTLHFELPRSVRAENLRAGTVALVADIVKALPMNKPTTPKTIVAAEAPLRAKPTSPPFPPDMVAKVAPGRDKRVLGDAFGLTNFGVNLTRLAPGGWSALRHAHGKQDEFVYIVEGEATLVTDAGETVLKPGMCAGFKAGTGDAHHLVNRTKKNVLVLEVGDRSAGDSVTYPDDDVTAVFTPEGKWKYSRKDGTPY